MHSCLRLLADRLSALTGFVLITITLAPTVAVASDAGHFKGFVTIAPHRQLYVDYIKPAAGQPTAVLLNGLTYRLGCWDAFVEQFKGKGLGILRYDMVGQGATLLKYAPILDPISIESQAVDLPMLLDALALHEPVHIVGLSYGSGVGIMFAAKSPERVASLILVAPFVGPIEAQDVWIQQQIEQNRLLFPENPASNNDLYEYFLRVLVYATYPAAEPIVLENPFKLEATYRLASGTRQYQANAFVNALPTGKVHLVVATKDQYVPAQQHEDFWNALPLATRASRLFVVGSEHKIPEATPKFAAQWIRRIISGDSALSGGHTFSGSNEKDLRQTN